MHGIRRRFPAKVVVATAAFGLPLAAGLAEAMQRTWPSGAAADAADSGGFLWVILVAALQNLGCDPVGLGRTLPLLSWSGLLAVLVVHAVRAPVGPWRAGAAARPARGTHRDAALLLPVSAWGLALHREAQIHAIGGDDASLLAVLLTGGLLLLVNHPRHIGLAAAVYALTVLLRPDGLLYSVTALAYAGWRGGRRLAWRFSVVWGALVVPYFVWHLFSDGRTIWSAGFAASRDAASWSRGWAYTSAYFRVYVVLVVSGLGALVAWCATARRGTGDPRHDVVLVALVQVLLTLVVVTRSGGDAVFGRAYIPVTPLLYLVGEEVVRVTGRRFAVAAFALVVLTMTLGARLSG